MELRQLRYFLATAEELSFSKAANRLFISQSTLSQQIRTLEDELGSPLFRRTSHSVMLTEAGQRLRPAAELTLRYADDCKTQISDMKKGLSGTLRIGVTHTCSGLLTRPLREFTRLYPKVRVVVHYTNSQSIRELLLLHQVDFALSMRPEHLPDKVRVKDVFQDRFCLICSRTHALANQKEVSLRQLENCSLGLPTQDLYARRAIDRILKQTGVNLQPQIEINNPDRLLDMVEHSQMVTLYTSMTVHDRQNLVAVPISDIKQPLVGSVYTLEDTFVKRSAEVLIDMLLSSADLLLI